MTSSDGPGFPALECPGTRASLRPLAEAEAVELAAALSAMPPWSVYPVGRETLYRYLVAAEPAAPRLALRLDGALAGIAGVRLNWLRGPYLQMLAILPQHQSKRAGSAILDWLDELARRAGEANVWACASSFNESALRFYERHGFLRTAVLDGLVAPGYDEILLRKRLRA